MNDQHFTTKHGLEIRRGSAGGPAEIYGYAAVFFREGDSGTEYRARPTIVERIMPGAFDSSLAGQRDIIATYDHNTAKILGRSKNGTLQLTTDDRGLRFSIPYIPDDPDHEMVAGKISRGLVTGASFSFGLPADGGEEIRHERDFTVRELHQVELYELGPVSMPAYYGSDAAVRCERGWESARKERLRIERFNEIQFLMRGKTNDGS